MRYTERQQWFNNRIGQQIFRSKNRCKCKGCVEVYEKGMIVTSENHASELCAYEATYNDEGIPFKFFDTKEEVKEFELVAQIN